MGILNVTPDSFSDGGKYFDPRAAAGRAREMVSQGADMIDVGGESSRPGRERIPVSEELERVIPVIKALNGIIDVPISIDTCKSEVAREALREGASIVNDITALRGDADMARVIAEFGASVILMHMKGDPGNMQDDPSYGDVMSDITQYLSGSIEIALEAGIEPGKIIVDPGIGFGKTVEHNLIILRNLSKLKELGKQVLVGTSRKSFLGALTDKDVEARTPGTAASSAAAIMNGADIIRVHDVGEMRDVALVVNAIVGEG
ncbi:MAG: dihydropteroate synthase [Candidatus Omnitrophica bacterium]|nr:dihydropteroate synthase [Candidatus Omnitrophota bacterium]